MAKKIIRTGTTADPIGDSLKNAFTKVNENFTELYNALGLDAGALNIGAFTFVGNEITTTDSSSIILKQAVQVTGELTVDGDIHASDIMFGSSKLTVSTDGAIYVNGQLAATPGGFPTWSSITGKPTFATVATSGAYADLSGKPTDVSDFTDTGNLLQTLVSVGSTAPVSPTIGTLWYDTVSGRMYIYYDSTWVDANPR
jgi:hypothetical protein